MNFDILDDAIVEKILNRHSPTYKQSKSAKRINRHTVKSQKSGELPCSASCIPYAKTKPPSMDDHIRTFTRLQTMADYHRPATNPPLKKEGHLEAKCVKKNRRDNNSNNINNPSKNRDNPCSLCR